MERLHLNSSIINNLFTISIAYLRIFVIFIIKNDCLWILFLTRVLAHLAHAACQELLSEIKLPNQNIQDVRVH